MKKWIFVLITAAAAGLAIPSVTLAQHAHGQGAASGGGMKMDTREVLVEGVKVVFQIMTNAEHQKMLTDMKSKEEPEKGTTHNIAVVLTDEKTKKEIMDAQVKMKLIDPKGADQVKSLRVSEAMKSYDNYFKLADKGQYQLLVAFKVGEQTRNAGVYYDRK
ncbi:MAG TPA: hypothetical protein VLR50_10890 [Desulfobacterales bacterium]|nr:hypothetical protein [Desulfobacterales bacterium]